MSSRDYRFADLMVGELRALGALPRENNRAFELVWFVFATRPRSVAELAAWIGVHRSNLARAIAAAGLPHLTRWVQLARALWVCHYIANTGETVSRAAHEGGYPDPFTFSRQLHRITGIRPSVIRRSGDWWPVLRAFVEQCQKPKAGAA